MAVTIFAVTHIARLTTTKPVVRSDCLYADTADEQSRGATTGLSAGNSRVESSITPCRLLVLQ